MKFSTILLSALAAVATGLPATPMPVTDDLGATQVRIKLLLSDEERFVVLNVFQEFNPPAREDLPITQLSLEPDGLLAQLVSCEAIAKNGKPIGNGFSLGNELNVALFEIDSISCQIPTSS